MDIMPRESPPMITVAGTGLRGGGQLLGGLIGVRGVVLREVANGTAPASPQRDGGVDAPVAQDEPGQRRGGQGGQGGRQIGPGTQGAQQGLLGGVLLCLDEEGAHDGTEGCRTLPAGWAGSCPSSHIRRRPPERRSPGWSPHRTHTGRRPCRPRRPRCPPHCPRWWRGCGGHPRGYRPPTLPTRSAPTSAALV